MQNPQDLLQVTLQSIRDAVVTTDIEARVQILNRAAESMTGWSSSEAAGKPIEEVVELRVEGSGNLVPNPVRKALSGASTVEDAEYLMLIGKDGCRTTVHATASPLHSPTGQIEGSIIVLHDANEALILAERISYLAHHDSLTGLPNRLLLVDRLEQGTKFSDRNNDQIAVIFVDLDHFGQIQNGSQYGSEPTFVNTNWNLDFSTSYDVTEQFTVYFEGMNLTDATYSTHGRYGNQLLDVVDYGRRFITGVHYKY